MLFEGGGLPQITLRTLSKLSIAIDVSVEHTTPLLIRTIIKLIETTDGMVLVKHIVDLQLWRVACPYIFGILIAIAHIEVLAHIVGHIILLYRLMGMVIATPEGGCDVKTGLTIV